MGWGSWVTLAGLLCLPAFALHRLPLNGWWLHGAWLILSAVTYLVYAVDKRRARANAWRVPELHLHCLELMGGWPGAWLAQGRLRHKCTKTAYQVSFWAIILIHQFIAFDSLQQWQWSRVVLQHFW